MPYTHVRLTCLLRGHTQQRRSYIFYALWNAVRNACCYKFTVVVGSDNKKGAGAGLSIDTSMAAQLTKGGCLSPESTLRGYALGGVFRSRVKGKNFVSKVLDLDALDDCRNW